MAYVAGSRRTRAAALKRWKGDDELHRYSDSLYRPEDWEPRAVDGETWPVANPWGKVPVVEVRVNAGIKASPFGGGRPQFIKQITTQMRINHTVFGRLITEDHQSFRQRWATDWDPPLDADGKPDKAAIIKASAARLMVFNNDSGDGTTPKVGEFAQADFSPFLKAVQEDVKHLATTSGTPPYAFLLGDMVNVAADALARIEGIHHSNVRSLADECDEAFVEIMRLALEIEGDPRASDPSLAVVWAEVEQRTATEQANLAQIMKNLVVPADVVFSTLPGVDQSEAARWVRQGTANALRAAALAPAPAP